MQDVSGKGDATIFAKGGLVAQTAAVTRGHFRANAERIIDCVNVLAGLNPSAVTGLVNAANAARVVLAEHVQYDNPDEPPSRELQVLTALQLSLSALGPAASPTKARP
ncbi:unnamed protein product [marine sediment metagenome]|uniref:Uncharacterized protein n=1 Tax=marine sediment metagenome TaxID=412755 RepID=X0U638_9ZZZZ